MRLYAASHAMSLKMTRGYSLCPPVYSNKTVSHMCKSLVLAYAASMLLIRAEQILYQTRVTKRAMPPYNSFQCTQRMT